MDCKLEDVKRNTQGRPKDLSHHHKWRLDNRRIASALRLTPNCPAPSRSFSSISDGSISFASESQTESSLKSSYGVIHAVKPIEHINSNVVLTQVYNTSSIQSAPIKSNPLEKILYLRNCSRFFHQIYAVKEEDLGHVSSKLHLNIWFTSKIITI